MNQLSAVFRRLLKTAPKLITSPPVTCRRNNMVIEIKRSRADSHARPLYTGRVTRHNGWGITEEQRARVAEWMLSLDNRPAMYEVRRWIRDNIGKYLDDDVVEGLIVAILDPAVMMHYKVCATHHSVSR
jgi:hypothetical protein